jgi:hypothetical protein
MKMTWFKMLGWLRKSPVKTPIPQAMVAQAAGQDEWGEEGWMAPLAPPVAQQPQTSGRQWDYPAGSNLQYIPRGNEGISFQQLRQLADSYDLVRLLIETRKDQMVKLKWTIAPLNPAAHADNDPRINALQAFFRMPDKRVSWQTWLRALLEDMLVIDAATVLPRMTRGGGLYALELMDGATIKPVIDESGRRPAPPYPAYQQVLKGVPAADYSADELLYVPRNVRTNKLYGMSPVEQIVMTVNIALRRQLSQLQFYTDGSAPDLIFSVPANWTAEQTRQFQDYWDNALSGNSGARRGTRFVPDGIKPFNTKEQLLKDDYDEWLARICCFAFSVSPAPFTKGMNRATAESAQETALAEGLTPLMQWVKDLLDCIIWQYCGYPDLQFMWQEEGEQDLQTKADIIDKKLRNGTLTINEARALYGNAPVEGCDRLMIYGATATPVDEVMARQNQILKTTEGETHE